MALVDLRGRAEDAEVQALAARVQPATGKQAQLLVGWREDDTLVGGVGIERVGDRELGLTSLYVLEEHRLRGIGRSLVEAVVAGAPVERFRVECEAGVAGFFERCGFSADGT